MLALFASIGLAWVKQYDGQGVFSFNYTDGWTKGPRKGGSPIEMDWLVNSELPAPASTPYWPAPISPTTIGYTIAA